MRGVEWGSFMMMSLNRMDTGDLYPITSTEYSIYVWGASKLTQMQKHQL